MFLFRKALLASCLLKYLTAVSSAATGDLLTSFNFGVNDMVVDPTRPLIYATVPSTNSIAVFNTNTLSLVATIPIGSDPVGLALSPDDSTLYVANSGSTANAIGVVNLSTLTALPSISAPSDPYYVAVGNGGQLYASTGNGIMQFNLGTGTYTTVFPGYPNYVSNGPLALSPDRNTLFEATEGISPATLQKYDISTATGTLLQSINTGEGGSAWPIVTSNGLGVIMANNYTLQELSTSNINTVIGTFNVGPYTGPAALSPDGQWLFTAAYDSLEMFNANTFVEKTSFAIPADATTSIAIDNSGRLIFVGEQTGVQVFSTGVNDNTATLTLGTLTIAQGASTDVISTTTSGSAIQVTPANGMASALFSGVSTVNVSFTEDNETATFDTTKFSFSPMVTIGGGTSTDSVVIQGSHVVTFTGTGTYGGGTQILGGVLAFNNGAAFGTGAVTLSTGTELRGIGTVTLNNTVNFASGTTNAIISAAAGGLLTLNNLDTSNTTLVTFGSAGNTGTIALGSGLTLGSNISGVTVAFGTLRNGGGVSQLISSAQVTTTVNVGATLALNDISATINSLGGAGSVTLGTKAATVLTLDATSFGGVISGAGSVDAAGSLTFTGASTYTGGTTIATLETLQLGSGGTTGAIVGNVSIGTQGLLVFDRSNAYSFAGVISGAGGVKQEGAGVLTLTGDSTYTGGTQVTAGVLASNNSNALGTGAVTLSTGTELRGSGTVTLNNTVNFGSGTTNAIISAAAGGVLTLNNLDTSNTNLVTFGSAGNIGTITLGSALTLGSNISGVTVAFGTLWNGTGVNQLISSAQVSTTVNAGATLALNDISATINSLGGAGAVTLGTKAATVLTLDGANFGGVISGMGSLNAAGSLTFTGANTYTGGTTIATLGTLQLGSGGATGSIVGNVSVGTQGLLVFDRSNAYSFAGVISGAGGVKQEGAGVLTLTGDSTYTGGTQVTAGVLASNNSNALGTGAVTLSTGTELRGSGTVTLNNTVNFGSGTTNAIISAAAGGVLTLNNLDTSNTNLVTFGSAGNIGTITLGSALTLGSNISGVTVAFGTLRNGTGVNQLISSAQVGTTVNAGATLALNDISATINSLGGAGSVTLGTKAATVLTLDAASFGGVISGMGSLNAAGSLTFTGANTYTGGTTIATLGTLQLGSGGATGSIVGNVSVGTQGLLVFDRSNAYSFAGVISGAGGVKQEGAGLLTLTGNSTYTGGTQVTAGVLAFNNSNALGTGAVTLSTGTELRGSGTVALNDTLNFATGTTKATLSATAGATFTVKNLDTTNTSALTFGSAGNAGTVAIGSGMTLGPNIAAATVAFGTLANGGGLGQLIASGQVTTTVNAGATLALNDLSTEVGSLKGAGAVKLGTKAATVLTLDSATFGGAISGAGSVDVNGTATFTGANTSTGGTKIAANQVLQLGNGAATGSIAGNVSLGSGATLVFDRGTAYSFSGVISGAGSVEQNGAGVLTLTGSNTYSGGTQVDTGVLAFSNAAALGSGSVTVGDGSELRGSGTITLNDAVSYGGTTSATISTNGTLTLTNLAITDTGKLNFGSAGNLGTVVIPSGGTFSANTNAQIEVTFGTLRNGGGLNALTSSVESTQVDTGATLAVNDFSLTIQNLDGAGTVNLGSKVSTVLTLEGALFQGTISGAGQVSAPGSSSTNGSGVVELTKANTYTGGTTVSGGMLVANNSTGSATGSGAVVIDSGAIIGGRGTVSGPMTLKSGGTVEPGANSSGVAGTKFHGSSLLWEGGATMDLQIGSTADELLLSGALTKGTAGTFTIEIDDAGIVAGNYTLATFASTTFSLSDFNLVLPTNYTGTLVETSTSLSIQNLQDPAAESEMPAAAGDGGALTSALPTGGELTPLSVPEPGSGLLLALGGSALLAWRRRRIQVSKIGPGRNGA